MDTLKFLSPLLVVSALADTTLLTGFLKGLAAAGFPATAADLGVLLASALVALWSRVRLSRKLDRKVAAAVAEHAEYLNAAGAFQGTPRHIPKSKKRGL